jgi:hypothetical protein
LQADDHLTPYSYFVTGISGLSRNKSNQLMLFKEIIAVYCENHTEHINKEEREREKNKEVGK